MTNYIHRTLIVPAALAPQARTMCETLAGPAGAGMFTTGLSATGTQPATHFISAGRIEDTFAALLDDPAVMHAACDSAGLPVTLAQCRDILEACTVSEDTGFVVMERLGLEIVSPKMVDDRSG